MITVLLFIIAFIVFALMFVQIIEWIQESDWYFYMSARSQVAIMVACGILFGAFSQFFWVLAVTKS